MKYTPYTEKQIAEMNVWPEGFYPFEIKEAEETSSKSGNDMIKLSVVLFGRDGRSTMVFDYLLDALPQKLRQCAVACGLVSEYEQGNLSGVHFVGKTGHAKVGIEKSKDPAYADKNKIVSYQEPKGVLQQANYLDDSIPF